MKYLLDTNTCIRYLNGRVPAILQRLATIPKDDVVVCSPVKGELFYGSARSRDPLRSLQAQQAFLGPFISLPFDDHAAHVYGRIRANLAERGTQIGSNDLLIAAIALTHNLTLVTHNVCEFSRVTGLALEDWETAL